MAVFQNSVEIGARGQKTLPAAAYLSEEIFAREQEHIFSRHWLCAARAHDLASPGQFRLRQIGTESIALVRDHRDQIHAHWNVCRHRGTRLIESERGSLARTIQCPYHAWTYALDGELVGVPDEHSFPGLDRSNYSLHPAACALWEGFVWLNLAESPSPFEHNFSPVLNKFGDWNLSKLVVLGERIYDVRANWKLIVQNYSECYHCAKVHPALVKLSPPKSGGNDLIDGPFLGGYMDIVQQGGSLTLSGRSCGETIGPLSDEQRRRVYYYVLFPNTLLSLHHDYVMVHTLWPQSPGQTRIECQWLFHPNTATRNSWNPDDGIEFWDQTNREDWHVSEQTQLGAASARYQPSPYSDREAMSAAFDRHYLQVMGGLGL